MFCSRVGRRVFSDDSNDGDSGSAVRPSTGSAVPVSIITVKAGETTVDSGMAGSAVAAGSWG